MESSSSSCEGEDEGEDEDADMPARADDVLTGRGARGRRALLSRSADKTRNKRKNSNYPS